MMSKNLKIFLIVIFVLLAGIKIFKKNHKNNEYGEDNSSRITKVLVKKIMPVEKDAVIELSGTIEAKNIVDIVPQTDGLIKEVSVTQGQRVKEGDIILIIDEKDKVAEVKRAEQLLEQRKKELEINNNLFKNGDVSLTSNNQAKTSYNDAVSQVERAKNQLSFTKVKATISGYIDKIDFKKGDYIDGKKIITRIFDDKKFIVSTSVPQSKVQIINVDQRAKIKLGDKEFLGTVKFVSGIADQGTKSYYGEVELNTSDADRDFMIKMINTPAQVKIIYSKLPAVKLPDSTLYINDDGHLTLKTLDENNIVNSIPVEILDSSQSGESWFYNKNFGSENEVNVIIRGGGFVNNGDKIDKVDYLE